jgi:hypothetical protein
MVMYHEISKQLQIAIALIHNLEARIEMMSEEIDQKNRLIERIATVLAPSPANPEIKVIAAEGLMAGFTETREGAHGWSI